MITCTCTVGFSKIRVPLLEELHGTLNSILSSETHSTASFLRGTHRFFPDRRGVPWASGARNPELMGLGLKGFRV